MQAIIHTSAHAYEVDIFSGTMKNEFYLVVSTHLKKIRQNWIISPNRVENKKYSKPPPSQTSILNWWAGRGSRLILSFFMTQKLTTVDHRIFRHVFTVRNSPLVHPRVPQAAREGWTIHDAATKSQSASEWPAKPNKRRAEKSTNLGVKHRLNMKQHKKW